MKLSELIKTSVVKIPGTDLEIVIKTELTWYEQLEYYKLSSQGLFKDELDKSKFLTSKLILSWNLQGEDGESLPITPEIITRLPGSVGLPIALEVQKIGDQFNEKKKRK